MDHWYTMEFKLGWHLLELLLDVKLVIHRDLQKSVTSEIGFWPTQEYELFKIQNKNNFYWYVLCINHHSKILKFNIERQTFITSSFCFFNFSDKHLYMWWNSIPIHSIHSNYRRNVCIQGIKLLCLARGSCHALGD